jgi:Zn-dependent alcohol dehydrogenase
MGKRAATVPGYSMNRYGVLGEEAIVPADSLAQYPTRLSTTEAAAIWMQYLTAYGALVKFGDVHAGDFVVITAASSSVGLAAIQIVKAQGATVIASTRTSTKREQLLSLGADHVIASEEENLVDRVKQLTSDKGARGSRSGTTSALCVPHPSGSRQVAFRAKVGIGCDFSPLIIIAPLCEELFFRGWLWMSLREAWKV